MRVTYGEMCEVIAKDWNKEDKIQITGRQVWDALSKTKFPALWCGTMYNAAETGDLVGLLLTDNTCAKIFFDILEG